MEKKIFYTLILLILSVNITKAQTPCKIAVINSIELLENVPGKAKASAVIEDLNQKYKKEFTLMQNDYNNKYTNFLSNQNTLSENIKLRRMQELHELEEKMSEFMKIAQGDIDSQEQQLIEPLRKKLEEAIKQVGIENSFTCIYDLANPTIKFITPNAINANNLVLRKLKEIK